MATLRQKRLAKKLVENSSSTMAEAMIEAGYSPATAVKPSQVINSVGFHDLLEKYLPDDKLLKKHDEALEATKWNDFTGEREEDHTTRLKAVELGYKLKRKLGPEIVQQFNSDEMKIEFVR